MKDTDDINFSNEFLDENIRGDKELSPINPTVDIDDYHEFQKADFFSYLVSSSESGNRVETPKKKQFVQAEKQVSSSGEFDTDLEEKMNYIKQVINKKK